MHQVRETVQGLVLNPPPNVEKSSKNIQKTYARQSTGCKIEDIIRGKNYFLTRNNHNHEVEILS